MNATLSDLSRIGKRGRLELIFSNKSGKTILSDAFHEPPFKITRPSYFPNSSLAQVILMSSAPGIFGGDELHIKIRILAGAQVRILSQGALKVHPSALPGNPAKISLEVEIEDNGGLHYLTEPVIPYPHSALQQTTQINAGKNAKWIFAEGFAVGRVARGETWQFDELGSETEIQIDGQQQLLERYRLQPAVSNYTNSSIMGDFHYLSSLTAYAPEMDSSVAENLFRSLKKNEHTLVGVNTPGEQLLTARILTKEAHHNKKTVSQLYGKLYQTLYQSTAPAFRIF